MRRSRCSTCRSKKIKRQRLALASKPHDVFFLCIVPSQNLDNSWNATALDGLRESQDDVGAGCLAQGGGRRELQDRVRARPGCLSRSEMAVAHARGAARSHVPQRQHRHRQSSGSAPPDRREAGPGRDAATRRLLSHHRRRRFRIRDRRRRSPARALHGGLRAGCKPPARRHHPALARRVRLDAAIRYRPRYAGRRLSACGPR